MASNWEKIKEKIYFVDGSLRDIYTNNINEKQWENWVNHLNENYKIIWNNTNKIDFEIIKYNWKNDCCSETAKIFIGNIQINCHFFKDFENDIDPNEIQSINDHYSIMDYMKNISEILDTTVHLSSENSHDNYFFKIYRDECRKNTKVLKGIYHETV
jgi:hypothetical protein